MRAHPGHTARHALGALTRSSAARPPLVAPGPLVLLQQLPDDGDHLLPLLQGVGTPDEAVVGRRTLVVGYDVLTIGKAHRSYG